VPVNLTHHVMSQILEHGEVRRGFLGVGIQDLTPAMAKAFEVETARGAIVSDVTPNSPAEKAGLRRGDVITGLNGKPVEDARRLRLEVAAIAPGTEIGLELARDGQGVEVEATLGSLPGNGNKPAATEEPGNTGYGVSVTDLTPQIARELGLPPGSDGVVVTAVQPGSAAAEAGIRRGDVIQEAGRQPVTTIGEFRDAVRGSENGSLLLLVNRAGRTSYVVLEPS